MSDRLFPSRRVLLEALVLVFFAIAVGLSLNSALVQKAFTGRTVVVKTSSLNQPAQQFPQPVDYEELDDLLASGSRLIDARDAHLYVDSHLPGAISLPLGEVDQRLEAFSTKVSRETSLILYCNGFGCPDSFDLGVRLIAEGYRQVKVYEGGFPEWRDRGRKLETGEMR